MYSEKLIQEVKECFPDNLELHKLAEKGSIWLGIYLKSSCSVGIPLDTVLTASTLEELQVEARLLKRKENCHQMWREEDALSRFNETEKW